VNTPSETLVELSKYEQLAYWIAGNPNTPVDLLNNYVNDEDENVRSSVAVNPSTPDEALERLSKDENEDVREAVGKNPKNK
jgi:hypothetical protein